MFNVTGSELLLILVIALIVLGPERLPDAARKLGQAVNQLRDLSGSFQREIRDAFEEQPEPIVKPGSRPQLTALEGGGGPARGETARTSSEGPAARPGEPAGGPGAASPDPGERAGPDPPAPPGEAGSG